VGFLIGDFLGRPVFEFFTAAVFLFFWAFFFLAPVMQRWSNWLEKEMDKYCIPALKLL